LVNKTSVSIHHVVNRTLFFPVAFIFNERAGGMVNHQYAEPSHSLLRQALVKPCVKTRRYKT
jgi:hypothetical protein